MQLQLDEAALVDLIEHAVRAATAPLVSRLAVLEQRAPVNGKDGRDGVDGTNGRDGIDGKDGKDGRDGVDGKAAIDGKDGRDGNDGKDGRDAQVDLEALAVKAARLIPIPKDGIDGKDGRDGTDGVNGKDGSGGIGIKAAAIDSDGYLLLTFDDGRLEKVGLVVGAKGADGRDGLPGIGRPGLDGKEGADGLGFDDIEVEHDGERAFVFVFKRGDRRKVCGGFTVPAQIYRGVYEEGKGYQRGDTVTWGGSQWCAKEATSAKPGGADAASRAWQLCVKKGSDGKPGTAGKDGQHGRDGKDGQAWPR